MKIGKNQVKYFRIYFQLSAQPGQHRRQLLQN